MFATTEVSEFPKTTAFWIPADPVELLPITIVPVAPAQIGDPCPMPIVQDAVVRAPVTQPIAILSDPVVKKNPEQEPIAVLLQPVVLQRNEYAPTDTLNQPVKAICEEICPTAVLKQPVVF